MLREKAGWVYESLFSLSFDLGHAGLKAMTHNKFHFGLATYSQRNLFIKDQKSFEVIHMRPKAKSSLEYAKSSTRASQGE